MSRFAGDEEFDVVIDKGCYDCVLADGDSQSNICNSMKEVTRVLKPGGLFISLSYSFDRMKSYEHDDVYWEGPAITVPIEKPRAMAVSMEVEPYYCLYVYKKGEAPPPADPPAEE